MTPLPRGLRRPLPWAALALAACGRPAPPEWRPLAEGFRPRPPALDAGPRAWRAPPHGGPALELAPGGGPAAVLVRAPYGPADWEPRAPHLWRAPRALPGLDRAPEAERARMSADGTDLVLLTARSWSNFFHLLERSTDEAPLLRALEERVEEPSFAVAGDHVYLLLPERSAPPERAVLVEELSLGHAAGDRWRVAVGGLVADGLPLLAGEPQEVVAGLPPGALLRFSTVALGSQPRAAPPATVRFRVELDGETLLDCEQAVRPVLAPEPHALPLGPRGRAHGRLTFSVEGPACLAAVLTPVVGPAEVGAPGARPWGAGPRDVVVLLADTFRADNLAAWGGDPELTPHLNALAAAGRRFLGARAPASWTLPSHAALFSGHYPHQAAVAGAGQELSDEAHTLAEHLAAAGYRTVAVTESAFVSRSYGLDQGFGWFQEHDAVAEGLGATLAAARARLAADDGRPLFLFVHSYRAHVPYVVSEETRARLAARYAFEGTSEGWMERIDRGRIDPTDAGQRAAARGLEALYRGASADLDRGYGALLEVPRLEAAVVAFTSDHGEAFGEHGTVFHMGGVWEEIARVPLVLRAPGLAPGEDRRPVSLVDLAPTLCGLAGVEAWPGWSGRDLLAGGAAPVLTFQCAREASTVAVVRGPRKLVAPDRDGGLAEGPLHAFDLARDPDERRDERERPWARGLARELAPVVDRARRPRIEARPVRTSAGQRAQLEALGYAGEGRDGEGD